MYKKGDKPSTDWWPNSLEARKHLLRFYKTTRSSRKYFEEFILAHCYNKKVLEYGCGTSSYTIFLAKHGADVTGIDISEKAINLAREEAGKEGIDGIKFSVMDAESMQFADNSFDLICGSGILHHLRLHNALSEIARVMKAEGKAIFIEPMGHNPAINLFRKLTPHLRIKDEHPLKVKDLEFMKNFFNQVDCSYFHIFSILGALFWNTRIFYILVKGLDNFDRKILKNFPKLNKTAWQVVIILEKPKKLNSKNILHLDTDESII